MYMSSFDFLDEGCKVPDDTLSVVNVGKVSSFCMVCVSVGNTCYYFHKTEMFKFAKKHKGIIEKNLSPFCGVQTKRPH